MQTNKSCDIFLAGALVLVINLTSCLLSHSPRCGVRVLKDDKCIHMDSCPCGSRWCYLCGKEGCPRGGGGCDEDGESTVMKLAGKSVRVWGIPAYDVSHTAVKAKNIGSDKEAPF